jgi:hypothetical protein
VTKDYIIVSHAAGHAQKVAEKDYNDCAKISLGLAETECSSGEPAL